MAPIRSSDHHQYSLRHDDLPGFGEAPAPRNIEYQVVLPLRIGEVLRRVIDDVVGANRGDRGHVRATAYGGDLTAERFGYLDRERPHAAGRAVNENVVPGLN